MARLEDPANIWITFQKNKTKVFLKHTKPTVGCREVFVRRPTKFSRCTIGWSWSSPAFFGRFDVLNQHWSVGPSDHFGVCCHPRLVAGPCLATPMKTSWLRHWCVSQKQLWTQVPLLPIEFNWTYHHSYLRMLLGNAPLIGCSAGEPVHEKGKNGHATWPSGVERRLGVSGQLWTQTLTLWADTADCFHRH